MNIRPILIQYHTKNNIKNNSRSVSNPLVTEKNSKVKTSFISFYGIIPNSDLIKKGYKVAKVDNNKISNSEDSIIINTTEKFLAFINSDYRKMYEDSVLAEIEAVKSSSTLSITEKTSIVQSRVGQGTFRQNLIDYWGGCAVTGFRMTDILVASHIKPWKDSRNNERLDVFNGLLLSPNYDKLFDRGYLTFNLKGKIEYSKILSQNDKLLLGLKDGVVLKCVDERHKAYLKYHNEKCFIG